MGESRHELLQWLNSLLQLSVNKVEQCGTGAAYCQIMDSIYMDVPMSRVKFNVNTEYQYLQNFKVLANIFTRHNIDRPLHTEQLIKCRMQDNLEFLQWCKRHWDQYFPGHDYDPVTRRKASGTPAGPSTPAVATSGRNSAAARRAAPASTVRPRVGPGGGGAAGGGAVTAALREENAAMKTTVEGLEKERDFYFSKLRDIELLLQNAVEENPELEKEENGLIKHVQAILYSTEDGFEIPEEGAVAEGNGEDLETF